MIRPKYYIIILDIIFAIICLLCAYLVRFGNTDSLNMLLAGGLIRVVGYLVVVFLTSYFLDLFNFQLFANRKLIAQRVLLAALLSFLILSALFYMFPGLRFWRGVLVLVLFFNALSQIASRYLISKFTRASMFANRILIVGAGELAQSISEIVPEDHNIHSYVRFIACTKRKPVVDPKLIVGNMEQINELVHDYRPQKLIIALNERRGNLPLSKLMQSKLRGVEILDATTYFEQVKGCLLVENMQPSVFIYTHRFRMTPFMRSYKRIYDLVFSVIGLIISAPFFPILTILIKLDSPGPVFYKQLRVGENEVEYFVYKFRTMAQDAEKETGAIWAQKSDPRVTRIGQFLRKTRIDEIPQLINVLKGEMSFIGPRPERMAFVERLKETIPFYSTRHFVKPGVTGWAQVCYPYGASDEDALEKLRYDLFYIKNYSIFLDFKIILDTIRVVTSGFGGR
ncbi:TIGR03013 family XrtA/PEP-CTERM system glycosyltransferase [uncultured Desulfuromusa sp.]|uniref:TIGR03013 family XrtA/PEP-CTERM system glycosyltransferase n=1 Tax=uncultured Desulfuromusa sp. TaxID=219183 RepID=UPI002AA795F9|nr:TIGR03013 family XrtA/PEP-CTERM system glycosyltransferase [uncultured Desulfuromusa sp.]